MFKVKSVVTTIGNIVTNLFSNDIYAASLTLCERIKLWLFKGKLNKWLKEYIKEHDGSILTSELFDNYLLYHKPIEKIFLNILEDKNSIGIEEFINTELSTFQEIAKSTRPLSVMDNRAFKELLSGIYDRINTFYRGTLSSNQKYIMGFESNLKSQLNTQIQKSENKILNEVANQTGELHKRFDDVCEILAENANSPLDPSVVWKVYEVLSRVIMNGKILEVVNILPLVQNKSLKCGLDFLIHVISNDQLYDYSFEMIERDVEDERIYADLIEKTIYILYARNDLELINKIGNRNADLYDIAKCLYHNSLDVFFILQVKRENGFLYYEYKMNEKYPKYNWLVKRICMVEMLKLNIANVSEGIIQVIGLAENIIDSILLYERRIQELLVNSKKKNSDVDKVIVALDDLLDRINGLSYYFRAKYYLTCLQARLILSSEDVMKYYDSLPSDIKQNGKIVMFKIQADLDSGNVDESLLLNTCIKEDEYWLLNNYLIHVVNNNPRYAKDIIEKYKFICDKDASIFLIYVQLIAHIENKENAVELLKVDITGRRSRLSGSGGATCPD